MKKKVYQNSVFISAIIWAIFTGLTVYVKYDLGTIATLGGIALMFAWDYERSKLTD